MTIKTAFVVLAAITSAAAVGCAGGGSSPGNPEGSGQSKASLHRAKNCDDLLVDLKTDAKWKVDHSVDWQIANIKACQSRNSDGECAGYGGYIGGGRGGDFAEDAAGSPTAGGFGPGSSSSSGSSGSSGSGGNAPPATPSPNNPSSGNDSKGAGSYSETNTQVKGVDEADIVKNDGQNIYVLHGNSFKVIHAFPATEMRETGTINIDGSPTEMFVADGKVVIYSQVNGSDVLTAAGVTPRKQYNDYGYGFAIGGGSGGVARGGDMAYPMPPTQPGVYVPLTKVTVLQLQGSTPVVSRESWYEGSYLDSRRVGSSVRTVFQGNSYGPQLKYSIYELIDQSGGGGISTPPYDPGTGSSTSSTGGTDYKPTPPAYDPYPKSGTETIALLEKLRRLNHEAIDASKIADWLPYTFVRANGGVSAATTACQDFYVPTAGSTENGITEVSTLDLADPAAAPRSTAILGRADTVYGNASTMYLAARAYVEPPVIYYDYNGGVSSSGGWSGSSSGASGAVTPTPIPPSTPGSAADGGVRPQTLRPKAEPNAASTTIKSWSQNLTHLHKFEFTTDAKFANYQASGTVRGNVKDQFSLDEREGILRIATTESRTYLTAENVYVPADSSIPVKGAPPPSLPQTVNHLFTLGQNGVDLELKGDVGNLAPNESIFSVRFVDTKGYVVTFRQVDPLFVIDLADANKPAVLGELTIPGFSEYMHPLDAGHLLTIGRDENRNLALQIFDVTVPTQPQRTHNLAFSGNGNNGYAQSDAEYDHKAFTYFADKQLLALPFTSYTYTNDYGMKSSLEIFHVDAKTGIQHLGDIDGSSLVSKFDRNSNCSYYGYGPNVRRGIFLDNTVYAISYGGIAAKDVGNLAAAPLTFPLPSPAVIDAYGAPIACYPGGEQKL